MQKNSKEHLEKLTDMVESYMVQWSSRDSYNDFRILLNIYMTLCHTVKRTPEESLILEHKLEQWIMEQNKTQIRF